MVGTGRPGTTARKRFASITSGRDDRVERWVRCGHCSYLSAGLGKADKLTAHSTSWLIESSAICTPAHQRGAVWIQSASGKSAAQEENNCRRFVMVSSFFTRGVRFTNSSSQSPRLIAETLRPTIAPRPELSRYSRSVKSSTVRPPAQN